jgi:hypothetical protein
MNPSNDRERRLYLIHGFLEKTLSGGELAEMEALLRNHEGARRELLLASALHQELFVLHELPAGEPAHRQASGLPKAVEAPGRRSQTLRSSRRGSSTLQERSWAPAMLAAAVLIGAVLLALMSSPEGRHSSPGNHDGASSREAHLPSVAPRSDPDSGDPQESASARAQEETSRRLADLARRRAELEQAAPNEADPKRAEQQKVDLGLLEDEKRKIEEDMRSAIEQARRRHPEGPGVTTVADSAPSPADKTSRDQNTPLASIERVEGEAYLIRKGSRSPAREGTELLPGDGLETSSVPARIVFRYEDRTRAELRGESSISGITDEALPGGAQGKQIQLVRGTLAAVVVKQPAGHPMLLKTPHAEALVLGTSLKLMVDPGEKGATRLEVHEGKVRFTRLIEKKAFVDVAGGHTAVAAMGIPLVSRPIPQPKVGTPERPVISGLALVSAESGRPLLQFDPLEDGAVITLANLSTRALNIQASTSPATAGSVLFSWDGTPAMEGRAPYFLVGNDTRGKPLAWTPAPGEHTLTVTPYSGPPAANKREGMGTAGTGMTVRLLVR